jgi:hypothetical protein
MLISSTSNDAYVFKLSMNLQNHIKDYKQKKRVEMYIYLQDIFSLNDMPGTIANFSK